MSGGEYNYVYQKINDIELKNLEDNYWRQEFQILLKLVANAMHDIEWVDSGDYGDGDEKKSIKQCFKFVLNNQNHYLVKKLKEIQCCLLDFSKRLEKLEINISLCDERLNMIYYRYGNEIMLADCERKIFIEKLTKGKLND